MIWQQIQLHEEKLLGFLLLVGVIVTIFFGPSPLLILAAAITGSFMLIAVPLTVLFSSTFYGLSVAIHLSDSIAVEKKQGRYIFMSLTPYGLAGTAWAMGCCRGTSIADKIMNDIDFLLSRCVERGRAAGFQ